MPKMSEHEIHEKIETLLRKETAIKNIRNLISNGSTQLTIKDQELIIKLDIINVLIGRAVDVYDNPHYHNISTSNYLAMIGALQRDCVALGENHPLCSQLRHVLVLPLQ